VIYLLDASIYVFRGWFALPDSLTTPDGQPANGFRGFAATLIDLLDQTRDGAMLVCFDESLTSSFRNEIDPDYKANRELPPPSLEAQFEWCRELCRCLGLTELASPRYEADDLMASLAARARDQQQPVTVISRDKDLAQILRPGDAFWQGPGTPRLSHAEMAAKLGFPPQAMADWLALTGDPVDNIPGVPGIGAKTATRLIASHESLEAVYANLATLDTLALRGSAGIRRKLEAGREAAFRARRLTRLHDRVKLPFQGLPAGFPEVDREALQSLHERIGLGQANWRKLRHHVHRG